jgi:hypothetical protein
MLDAAAPRSAAAAFSSSSSSSAGDLFAPSPSPTPSAAPSLSGSSAPMDLVPHEVAHVVQQSAGSASAAPFAGMY